VHDVLHGNGRVCINVLGARGQEPARVFAGMTGCSMQARFDQCAWHAGRLAVPVLDDAIATLEGTIIDSKTIGSHSVIFVRIEHIDLCGEGNGLVYFGRRFHLLTGEAA
jgi:flavin reductase (NADH)